MQKKQKNKKRSGGTSLRISFAGKKEEKKNIIYTFNSHLKVYICKFGSNFVIYKDDFPRYESSPPSAYKIWPLTKSEASEARNTAGPIRSSDRPQRAAGVWPIMN